MVKALLLDKKNQSPAPTPVKAVEESCVTCGGAHFIQYLHQHTNGQALSRQNSRYVISSGVWSLKDVQYLNRIGIAKDVYVTVGKFQFPPDFVVVDFEPDPRVPLILERSFLKTSRALIDVYEGEITLRVGREAITFNLDQTSRGNPTPYYDPIVSTASSTLTPFGDSDFLLFEEADSFLAIEDDPTSPEVDPTYYDPEGDILLLETILNSAPSPPLQGNYFPETRKDLKICEANNEKSSVNEPPEVELKDLPPHLEYAFLEGDDKLPVIIAKDLKNEEKAALIENFVPQNSNGKRNYEQTFRQYNGCPWVSPVHCVPKKGGMTVIKNDENDLIPTRLVTGWRVCIDYRKLNEATRKDHFPLPFMDQMLERLAGNQFYCFLDGFSGYFQIPIDPKDQEKTTFTCPYAYILPIVLAFGLSMATPAHSRSMMAIFHDMIEKTMEVFMDDSFQSSVDSFTTCYSHVDKMLKRCEDTNLVLQLISQTTMRGTSLSRECHPTERTKCFKDVKHLLSGMTPSCSKSVADQMYPTVWCTAKTRAELQSNGHRLQGTSLEGDSRTMDIPDLQNFLRILSSRKIGSSFVTLKQALRGGTPHVILHLCPGIFEASRCLFVPFDHKELHNPQLHLGIPIS
ncbi:reverse transcriptase domain-containing protein [Tanacetum coccineum]|uniref:Reverse transcriptase domain-containing protein n=1 Tax=Tanacetum coccineum TaxID=301880 RepID=A0ABQ5DZ24_9ASTR